MDVEALLRHRSERDEFMVEHYASPLPEEHQGDFTGLLYYPPDEAWTLVGRFEAGERQVPIPSSAGTESEYRTLGEVIVAVDDREYRLVVLDDGDGEAFIPFRDATSGHTTYAGGRYVRPDIVGTDVTIDFNLASNPWCVYDDDFSCPLPPAANVISSPIPAGEQMWSAGAHRP